MYLLYKGPSMLDGGPIICLMTGVDRPSLNRKTGPMTQTYIIREDMHPQEARITGQDKSICGLCPHRNGACYVNLGRDPAAVYQRYLRDNYRAKNLKALGYNRKIRLGAYGDAAAVPITVWDDLLTSADGWTGYTHSPFAAPGLKRYCQASADTPEQAALYQSLGWRTFRIKNKGDPVAKNETLCPYPKSGMQCIQCMKCNGSQSNIVTDVHGVKYKQTKFKEAEYAQHPTKRTLEPIDRINRRRSRATHHSHAGRPTCR